MLTGVITPTLSNQSVHSSLHCRVEGTELVQSLLKAPALFTKQIYTSQGFNEDRKTFHTVYAHAALHNCVTIHRFIITVGAITRDSRTTHKRVQFPENKNLNSESATRCSDTGGQSESKQNTGPCTVTRELNTYIQPAKH